jgi:hypothetical protein
VKQLGRNPVWDAADIAYGRHEWLSDRKGSKIEEFPFDLRVREWPKTRHEVTA